MWQWPRWLLESKRCAGEGARWREKSPPRVFFGIKVGFGTDFELSLSIWGKWQREKPVFTNEVLRSAAELIHLHGENAYLVATEHYDTLLESGDHGALETWTQVLWAIESFCSDRVAGTIH